jgi:hypothetical protein
MPPAPGGRRGQQRAVLTLGLLPRPPARTHREGESREPAEGVDDTTHTHLRTPVCLGPDHPAGRHFAPAASSSVASVAAEKSTWRQGIDAIFDFFIRPPPLRPIIAVGCVGSIGRSSRRTDPRPWPGGWCFGVARAERGLRRRSQERRCPRRFAPGAAPSRSTDGTVTIQVSPRAASWHRPQERARRAIRTSTRCCAYACRSNLLGLVRDATSRRQPTGSSPWWPPRAAGSATTRMQSSSSIRSPPLPSIGGVPRSIDRAVVAKEHPMQGRGLGRSEAAAPRFRVRPPADASRSEGPIG